MYNIQIISTVYPCTKNYKQWNSIYQMKWQGENLTIYRQLMHSSHAGFGDSSERLTMKTMPSPKKCSVLGYICNNLE